MSIQEYLVDIRVKLPSTMTDEFKIALMDAEGVRGRQLVSQGVIDQIWRVPGSIRNVGVWHANDATELHSYLESLPLFRYMEILVIPLAQHPLNAEHNRE